MLSKKKKRFNNYLCFVSVDFKLILFNGKFLDKHLILLLDKEVSAMGIGPK